MNTLAEAICKSRNGESGNGIQGNDRKPGNQSGNAGNLGVNAENNGEKS